MTIINKSTCVPTLHGVVLDDGGTQVYSQGFEFDLGSWAASGLSLWARGSGGGWPVHGGAWSAKLTGTGNSARGLSRVFTGLTVDREYLFSAWIRTTTAARPWSLGVTGIGDSPLVAPAAVNTWEKRTYTFRATATTHTLVFTTETGLVGGDGIAGYVDDITLTEGRLYGDLELDPSRTQITLDESNAPFGGAVITIPLPPEITLASIDPRDDIRLTIDAANEWILPLGLDPQLREFDLLATVRRIDHEAGTVELTAHTDEAKLLVTGNSTAADDRTAYPVAPTAPVMLRTVVNSVLDNYGAALQPGAADADVSPVTPAVNLIPNPNVRTAITGWTVNGASSTVTRQTGLVGGPVAGVTTFARAAFTGAPGAGVGGVIATTASGGNSLGIEPGVAYELVAWVRSNVAKTVRIGGTFRDAAGTALGGDAEDWALVANTWTKIRHYLGVAPAGSTQHSSYVLAAAAAAWASGNTLDVLGWVNRAVPNIVGSNTETWGIGWLDSWDGDSPDDTYYGYAWQGTANASPSVRTPLSSRDPSTLLWRPGVLAWDFIHPLVQAAGLRLFCDEQRRWYLVNPATYTAAGSVELAQAVNVIDAADTISIEDDDWADGVVIAYSWTDEDGAHLDYDAAGSGSVRLIRRDVNSPFPGAGAAAAILARASGRGRQQDIAALTDLDTTPGMALTADLPNTPEQIGVVSSVEWTWNADGGGSDEMRVRARDLEDA